jgi:hypothetical protein
MHRYRNGTAMRHLSRILLVLPLAGLAGSCMLLGGSADRATRNSPDFKAGYSDGCASANAEGTDFGRGGAMRDQALFDSDKAYRMGWSAGVTACRSAVPMQAGPQSGPIPDRNPGGGN